MKKTLIAAAVVSVFALPSVVLAADAAPAAPASPHTITANVGVVSDYLFRGISQTHGKPAVQGGVDYSHSSGFYAGAWGSTIKWVKDAQDTSVPVELDIYGGYKNTFAGGDWNYDVGYITYNYPGSKDRPTMGSAKANTQEVYGSIGWKWLSAKYSYATSSHFIGWYGGAAGDQKTRGSDYLELNANYDVGNGWTLIGHVGHQKVKNYASTSTQSANYTDYKVGVTKDVGFGVVGFAYSDTNAKGSCSGTSNAYCWGEAHLDGSTATNVRDASKGQAVLSFSKTF